MGTTTREAGCLSCCRRGYGAMCRPGILLFAVITGCLKAAEGLRDLRAYKSSTVTTNGDQERIGRNGSPTGILEGRSYDPWKALRAVLCTGAELDQSVFLQVFEVAHRLDNRGAVEVQTVLLGQLCELGLTVLGRERL